MIRCAYDALKDIPNALLVDVGASTGSFSLLPVILPNLSVCAFEPNPAAAKLLRQNAQLNGLGNERFALFPVGLAAGKGIGKLSIPVQSADGRGSMGCATFGKLNGQALDKVIDVPLARLDDMTWNRRVDFIKIDAECAEKYVLEGAAETIARFRPLMLVECSWATQVMFGYAPSDVPALIEQYGYSIEYVSEGNALCRPL